jgi:hypothetical protein
MINKLLPFLKSSIGRTTTGTWKFNGIEFDCSPKGKCLAATLLQPRQKQASQHDVCAKVLSNDVDLRKTIITLLCSFFLALTLGKLFSLLNADESTSQPPAPPKPMHAFTSNSTKSAILKQQDCQIQLPEPPLPPAPAECLAEYCQNVAAVVSIHYHPPRDISCSSVVASAELTVDQEGHAKSISLRPSTEDALNRAFERAIRDSEPFPPPPATKSEDYTLTLVANRESISADQQ